MFKRSFRSRDVDVSMTMDSQYRVDKAARLARKGTSTAPGASTVRNPHKLSKLQRSLSGGDTASQQRRHGNNKENIAPAVGSTADVAPAPIVTLVVGRDQRLFAAHEDVLCRASFFDRVLHSDWYLASPPGSLNRRIALPDEEPEAFSTVLEYLYKGDYYPRLLQSKNRDSWELEGAAVTPTSTPATRRRASSVAVTQGSPPTVCEDAPSPRPCAKDENGRRVPSEAIIFLEGIGQHVLRDTVVYCSAERYGLDELKKLALRKQGLRTGIDVGTILRSAQYCYAHTPDSDSRLRAHYLALIIRCRKVFKRSGTMQAEMERLGSGQAGGALGEGSGKLFFDLFVALCNHLDDVIDASNSRSPRTI